MYGFSFVSVNSGFMFCLIAVMCVIHYGAILIMRSISFKIFTIDTP